MYTCDIKWLIAVEGHKPGDEQHGLAHDEFIDQWAGMGLLRITRTDKVPGLAPGGIAPTRFAPPQPPPRNASREAWFKFLRDEGIDLPSGASRGDMIRAWEHDAD